MESFSFFSHLLDPEVSRKFSPLCEDVEGGDLPELVHEIDEHISQVHQALALNEFLDVAIAESIATVLRGLLGDFEKYPQTKKRLIVGAVRYFVKSNDAQADLSSVLGFDDVAVVNYVLVELGRSDLRIKL